MRNKMRYETPEIEVTRFEVNRAIMDLEAPTADGPIATFDPGAESEVEESDLPLIFD